MKSNQYLALWNLKILNEQAFQKYKYRKFVLKSQSWAKAEHIEFNSLELTTRRKFIEVGIQKAIRNDGFVCWNEFLAPAAGLEPAT